MSLGSMKLIRIDFICTRLNFYEPIGEKKKLKKISAITLLLIITLYAY